MSQTIEFLKRASEKNGFIRERYEERKIPTEISQLTILPFFGDLESCFILSSLLLRRYREEIKGSKYFILLSWPGLAGLFPYVDEYWSIADKGGVKSLYQQSEGFLNNSSSATLYLRSLNEHFRDVVDHREFQKYYSNGLTNDFFEKYKNIKVSLPMVPSTALLGKDFNRDLMVKGGYKVFIAPSNNFRTWQMGKTRNISIGKDFWLSLVKRLVRQKMTPVIWKNCFGYDISSDLGDLTDKCVVLAEDDISKVMAAMRATGMVLDIFSGISRLAIAARCPYFSVEERSRFINEKVYEIDDLCSGKLPKKYSFSFASIVKNGEDHFWDNNLFNGIFNNLDSFIPELNREDWPTTGESYEVVSHHAVRQFKLKTMGTKFIKVEKV